MAGIGIGLGLALGGGSGAGWSDAGIARTLAARGLSDADARGAIGAAASLAAGLRSVGLLPPLVAATPAAPARPAPTGFALNGSTNPSLKAMLARVGAGTGRGRISIVGDSTSVGDGAGAGGARIAGARANRPSAVLAALLGGAGYPALDNSIYTANVQPSGSTLSAYDPRVSLGAWSEQGPAAAGVFADFAGSGFLAGGGSPLTATFQGVDTFEVAVYNTDSFALTFRIDGQAPASGPASQSFSASAGTTKVVLKAGSVGAHTLSIAADSTNAALRSILAYDAGTPAIDILCHAGCAQTSANLAATAGNATRSRDQLAQDASDVAIVFAAFNDMNQGVSAAAHGSNLGAIIDTQRAHGDVLVVGAWRGSSASFDNADIRAATASVAAAKGVAFVDLDAHYGAAVPPAMFDAVHRTAAGYADIADVYRGCLMAMAGF
jgi:hypothetical protein